MEILVFSSSPLAQFPCLFWCRSQSHPEVRLCFWQIPPCSLHTDIPTFLCTFPPSPVIYLFFFLCISDRTLQPHSGLAALQAYRRDTVIICLYLRFLFSLLLFLPPPNCSALMVMALAATVIGRSILYETFCVLLLFYYRQKSRGDFCSMQKQLFPWLEIVRAIKLQRFYRAPMK